MSLDFYMRVSVHICKWAYFFPQVGLAPTNSSFLFTSLNAKMSFINSFLSLRSLLNIWRLLLSKLAEQTSIAKRYLRLRKIVT